MSVTFQLPMGALKAVTKRNMPLMVVTCEVSQREMSRLKPSQPAKARDMSWISEVFQSSMGPYRAASSEPS